MSLRQFVAHALKVSNFDTILDVSDALLVVEPDYLIPQLDETSTSILSDNERVLILCPKRQAELKTQMELS